MNLGGVGLVTVVNGSGNVFYLGANRNRDGFSSRSGLGEAEDTPSAVNPIAQSKTEVLIRKLLEIERSQEGRTTYDPHAIVHKDYEADFRRVATALGLQPERVSDELF